MIIWVLLKIHSQCQWIPVRTVSYGTTSQRARMRRFLLAEIQLFQAMSLNTQFYFVKWRLLKVIFGLYLLLFYGQRKIYEESKTALTFYLFCLVLYIKHEIEDHISAQHKLFVILKYVSLPSWNGPIFDTVETSILPGTTFPPQLLKSIQNTFFL